MFGIRGRCQAPKVHDQKTKQIVILLSMKLVGSNNTYLVFGKRFRANFNDVTFFNHSFLFFSPRVLGVTLFIVQISESKNNFIVFL